jgi:hypothetical protein
MNPLDNTELMVSLRAKLKKCDPEVRLFVEVLEEENRRLIEMAVSPDKESVLKVWREANIAMIDILYQTLRTRCIYTIPKIEKEV